MRWNVVIGGQMFSKSMRGFRETYVPELFEKEGILAAVVIFVIPFVLLDHLRSADPDLHRDPRRRSAGAIDGPGWNPVGGVIRGAEPPLVRRLTR